MTTTPPRVFNEIIDLGEYYLKISKDIEKIEAEIDFYQTVPEKLRNYYPEVDLENVSIGEKVGYKIKKIPTPDASYYFVSGMDSKHAYFNQLIIHLSAYLKKCPAKQVEAKVALESLDKEIILKDKMRLVLIKLLPEMEELVKIVQKYGFKDLDHYLDAIHKNLFLAHSKIDNHELVFSHGDMCLSNILFFKDQLYLIDPKGCSKGGDNMRTPYYDYAKLSQCFNGNYDYINLLQFDVQKEGFVKEETLKDKELRKIFKNFCTQNNINEEYLLAIQATFFFSMIPLHSESFVKMRAFLINSIQSWRTLSNE